MNASHKYRSRRNHSAGSERRRVYVVDDEQPDLAFLESVLAEAGYETLLFSSGDEFLQAAGDLPRGCVVLDVKLPGAADGLQVLKSISMRRSELPAVMISGKSDIPIAVETMKLGALDFVEKPCKPADLAKAVDRAFREARKLEEEAAEARSNEELLSRISPREMDVLRLLMEGRRNKAVAFELGISERTVEVHRSRMMRRLGLGSFAELIRLAVHLGLASDPPLHKPRAN